MRLILLSGGSGKRLWPLSNDTRSKQFLKILECPGGMHESMVQRVVRQIRNARITDDITFATSASQCEIIKSQLGDDISVVAEPCRRDTFPAIALAAAYLAKERGCSRDEVVVVMPCDSFTEAHYFDAIREMGRAVEQGRADLVLMGIKPTYPSAKYGYVVPEAGEGKVLRVNRFTEKPDVATAERLIAEGALWNGGVFGFRLGYIMDIAERYVAAPTFEEVRGRYTEFPKISFDYEVAEKAKSVAVVVYDGEWKDLGTWNTLTDEISCRTMGNVVVDDSTVNTHVINELDIPIMCIGGRDLVIAASRDGILITDKSKSEQIKAYAERLSTRPMKISIITATWNSAATLRDTMESVLRQSYGDFEHIIVDGGSKDATLDIVREMEPRYKGRLRWVSEKDRGLYDAMNKGLRLATGDVVGILNSDDFYTNDHVLERIASTIDDHTDAVYGDIHFVDDADLSRCVRYYSSRPFRPWKMKLGLMPAHPSFYCRTRLYERHGGFDLSYRIGADFENLVRLIYKGRIRTQYIPMDFVTMRTGGASTSGWNSYKTIFLEQLRALRANGVTANPMLLCMRYPMKVLEVLKYKF